MADDPEIRLHEHNRGIIAYLSNQAHEPPEGCQDAEGWRRGYASARMAILSGGEDPRDG
jgi:hypothetical protein